MNRSKNSKPFYVTSNCATSTYYSSAVAELSKPYGETAPGLSATNKSIRNYKDSVFRMLFSDKKELLALYNALNDSHYDNPEELEIKTLENAIFMTIKNDISFILDSRILLFEQQSTFNPNMPLRDLFYVADQYQELVKDRNLYKPSLVKIPMPRFVVFYNGSAKRPSKEEFRLSDSFDVATDNPQLELVVTSLNINPGYNEDLMSKCSSLRDYSLFVEKVREYTEIIDRDAAVIKAVDECIKEGILAEFLKKQKSEVIKMTIYEFDQKQYDEDLREEGREEARKENDISMRLIEILIKNGEIEKASKAATDRSYREKLFKDYKLK